MSIPAQSAAAPGRRRLRKRIFIPLIVLALVIAIFLWSYVRGTWADSEARHPRTAAEGTIVQLYRTPEGDVQVRCAMVIDAPANEVWDVIRDYANHPRFFPYVSTMEVVRQEGDRVFLTGTVQSRLWGDWSFAMHVDHKEKAGDAKGDKEYTATWNDPSPSMPVNRGSWTVTAAGRNRTIVVYALEVEAAGYPNFFVRHLLLNRLARVVSALGDEVKRRQAAAVEAGT